MKNRIEKLTHKFLVFSISFLMISPSFAQIPPYNWGHSIGGLGADVATDVTTDSLGNTYITGYFVDTVDFDPSSNVLNGVSSSFSNDIFVLKLNINGDLVWIKTLGSSGMDRAHSIAYSEDGSIYVTGFFSGTVDFDSGPANFDLSSAGLFDMFILKLNALDGSFSWAKRIGNSFDDVGNSVEVKSDTVYLTGYFRGIVDFDPNADTVNLTNVGNNDIFILKLDRDGNLIWAKNVGSSTADQGNSIVVGPNNEVYITGYFQLTADFDPGSGNSPLSSAGGWDIFILKLQHDGSYAWSKRMGSPTSDVGNGIKLDQDGNIYTVGKFTDNVDFNPDPAVGAVFGLFGPGGDAFVQKLDPAGNFLWARKFGGQTATAYLDEAKSIDIDEFGDIYITGYFTSPSCNFDFVGSPALISLIGSSDAFITKLNSTGGHQWVGTIAGTGLDEANAIAINQNGNIYSVGSYSGGPVDLDMSAFSIDTVRSNGNTDIFIQKLNQCFEVAAAPVDNTPLSNLTYCEYNTTILTATGNGIIYWYDSNTSSTVLGVGSNFTPPSLVPGTYTFYAEDSVCVPSDLRTAITVNILGCLGVEGSEKLSIVVYPNPFTNMLTVSGLSSPSQLMITDMLGKVIYKMTTESEIQIIDLQNLADGNYILSIQSVESSITKKIIKN